MGATQKERYIDIERERESTKEGEKGKAEEKPEGVLLVKGE